MKFDVKELGEGGVELAVGTTATILSLHALRFKPNYSGWILLGAGILGYMMGNKIVKTASIVAASVGAVKAINMLASENGVPASYGVKGMINKVVPQLNGVPLLGMGSVEQMNENLLGTRAEDLLGLNDYDTDLEGVNDDALDQLTGSDSDEAYEEEAGQSVEGFGSLM